MSAFDSKHLHVEARRAGRAQRTLASLRNAHGYRVVEGPPGLPEVCRICPMDSASCWRLVAGRGPGATYEVVEGDA